MIFTQGKTKQKKFPLSPKSLKCCNKLSHLECFIKLCYRKKELVFDLCMGLYSSVCLWLQVVAYKHET